MAVAKNPVSAQIHPRDRAFSIMNGKPEGCNYPWVRPFDKAGIRGDLGANCLPDYLSDSMIRVSCFSRPLIVSLSECPPELLVPRDNSSIDSVAKIGEQVPIPAVQLVFQLIDAKPP
jgi:hypothetical protein